ncbi:MAG: lactonase family protein [Planctomycetota bacterium]
MHVYFGTYTRDRDEGVYRGRLDPDTGGLTVEAGYGGVTDPSFLTLHPGGGMLYAVNESDRDSGVTAFAIDRDTGDLSVVGGASIASGRGACHVAVDPAGAAAVVSYYGSGTVASFPLDRAGVPGEAVSVYQHEGSSLDPQRQEGPHAHSTSFDPTGRFALSCDLGIDQVKVHRFDQAAATLTPHDPPAFGLHPGAGPRHLAFHPTRPLVYIINELDATVTVAAWDATAGTLTRRQVVSTLPEGFDGRRSTAEVLVHPSGRFVYGSNRGHDSLVVYAVDPDDGTLTLYGFVDAGGAEPRNFNFDPTRRWAVVCHQNGDTVRVFAVDADRGGLTPVGEPVAVPMPVCVKFLEGG